MQQLTQKYIKSLIKPRKPGSNKGDHGHALLIAGKRGSMGAAVIAAEACLRTGAGLVTVNVPQDERSVLQTAVPEAMLSMREEVDHDIAHFSAIGIGPAIGTDKPATSMLIEMITGCRLPLLLDADALRILSENEKLLDCLPENTILTPHAKEFDRLFGPQANDEHRKATAVKKAAEKNIIIVLKGPKTLITVRGKSFVNTTGNAGLAKGGSGDALTGIITSFLAQHYKPLDAAVCGVYIHGLSADLALKDQSPESMLITDAVKLLGKAFKKIN